MVDSRGVIKLLISMVTFASSIDFSEEKHMTCGNILHINQDQYYYLVFLPQTPHKIYHRNDSKYVLIFYDPAQIYESNCKLELKTVPSQRLRVVINYTPKGVKCSEEYLHIGNDRFRQGIESMTSYKFCDVTKGLEIVSRSSYLWLVYNNRVGLNDTIKLQVEAKSDVVCGTDSFRCSPLQCVAKDKVCDGRRDCENHRDEYCYKAEKESTEKPYFMCDDERHIRPMIPYYSEDRGKPLWFICDGTKHCKDGSDERKDMCLRRGGKTSHMIKCVASTRRNFTGSVMMWKHHKCDGIQDCQDGADEICDTDTSEVKRIQPAAIAIATGALVIFLAGASIFIYNINDISFLYLKDYHQVQTQIRKDRKRTVLRRTSDYNDTQTEPMETCRLQPLETVVEEPDDNSTTAK